MKFMRRWRRAENVWGGSRSAFRFEEKEVEVVGVEDEGDEKMEL